MIMTLALFGFGAMLIGIYIGVALNLRNTTKAQIVMRLILALGVLWVMYSLVEWRMLEWIP